MLKYSSSNDNFFSIPLSLYFHYLFTSLYHSELFYLLQKPVVFTWQNGIIRQSQGFKIKVFFVNKYTFLTFTLCFLFCYVALAKTIGIVCAGYRVDWTTSKTARKDLPSSKMKFWIWNMYLLSVVHFMSVSAWLANN